MHACVLRMSTLCLGLKFEVPTELSVTLYIIVYSIVCTILKLVICVAVCVLRMSTLWLGLGHHRVWCVVISVLQDHSVSNFTIFMGHPTVESLYS
jgi:hypothetical protein